VGKRRSAARGGCTHGGGQGRERERGMRGLIRQSDGRDGGGVDLAIGRSGWRWGHGCAKSTVLS
jgi:hypothetical protein